MISVTHVHVASLDILYIVCLFVFFFCDRQIHIDLQALHTAGGLRTELLQPLSILSEALHHALLLLSHLHKLTS